MTDAVRRSWLLTPASNGDAVHVASSSGADVVVLDLVSLIPESAKHEVRLSMQELVGVAKSGGAEVFVHVDSHLLQADLEASVWPGLSGAIISQTETTAQIQEAASLLTNLEDRRGIVKESTSLIASVETPTGNHNAYEIGCASSRLWGLTLGRVDLFMNLRPEPSGEIHMLPYLLQRLITIAHAIKITPLGAWWRPPSRGLRADAEITYQSATRARMAGAKGSLCVCPTQVEPLNRGFSPEPEEVEESNLLVRLSENATLKGEACFQHDGKLIDISMIKKAENTLAYHEACNLKPQSYPSKGLK